MPLPGLPFGVTSAVISVEGGHLEVAGALVDAVGHVRGGEQPLGFAAIGVGYVLVAGGAIGSLRTERHD